MIKVAEKQNRRGAPKRFGARRGEILVLEVGEESRILVRYEGVSEDGEEMHLVVPATDQRITLRTQKPGEVMLKQNGDAVESVISAWEGMLYALVDVANSYRVLGALRDVWQEAVKVAEAAGKEPAPSPTLASFEDQVRVRGEFPVRKSEFHSRATRIVSEVMGLEA